MDYTLIHVSETSLLREGVKRYKLPQTLSYRDVVLYLAFFAAGPISYSITSSMLYNTHILNAHISHKQYDVNAWEGRAYEYGLEWLRSQVRARGATCHPRGPSTSYSKAPVSFFFLSLFTIHYSCFNELRMPLYYFTINYEYYNRACPWRAWSSTPRSCASSTPFLFLFIYFSKTY
jgi:hypothetical protein